MHWLIIGLPQCRISNSSKYLPPLHRRRRLPPLQHVHVQRPTRQLGRYTPRLRRTFISPDPSYLLEIRR